MAKTEKPYDQRFPEQRDKVLLHYDHAFRTIPAAVPQNPDDQYFRQLRQGVEEYIQGQGYFKLTPAEIKMMTETPTNRTLFAAGTSKEEPSRWRHSTTDDVVRKAKEAIRDKQRLAQKSQVSKPEEKRSSIFGFFRFGRK